MSSTEKNSEKSAESLFSSTAQTLLSQLDTTLEKAGLGRALSFLNETASGTRKLLANERILTQLKRIGVASSDEIEALQARVASLEDEVKRLRSQ